MVIDGSPILFGFFNYRPIPSSGMTRLATPIINLIKNGNMNVPNFVIISLPKKQI